VHRSRRSTLRRLAVAAGAAAAVLALVATAASAATGPGFYAMKGATGASFQVLSTNDLVNIDTDDSLFGLSTTGTGKGRLPFPLHAYDQTYQTVVVDSNGVVDLGTTVTALGRSLDVNQCMPTGVFTHPAVAAYWDDLTFRTADTSHGFPDGIFTRTSGTAPHRTFLVSWQGVELDTNRPVLAQVAFHEGSQNLTFTYGTDGGASATVGIQSKEGLSSDQWSCNTGSNLSVTSGLRIALTHHDGTEPAA
jgi:hypothetical protein